MELWNKYTTAEDRELFANANNCCSMSRTPIVLNQKEHRKLQFTITKVFSQISLEELKLIYNDHPKNNDLVIEYFVQNFLYHVASLHRLHESDILWRSNDYKLDIIIIELNKYTNFSLDRIYNLALYERHKFPNPFPPGIDRGVRGPRGCFVKKSNVIDLLIEKEEKILGPKIIY